MLLIIMILSMPVYGQAGVNDFAMSLNVDIDAPQWDERLGHFDILPEVVAVATRYPQIETSQPYYILDTLLVTAERSVPVAGHLGSRPGYEVIAFSYLKYSFYIVIAVIMAAMVAIMISQIPDGFQKNQVFRKTEMVRSQDLLRRKR